MEGTRIPAETLIVVDRYGRPAEGTLTRAEWLELEREHDADTVEVVRYHRELLGQAA